MARIASHLVCPYLFHKGDKKKRWNKSGSKGKGKDSMTFGHVFEEYIYKKISETEIASRGTYITYLDVRGIYDIATPTRVIEVKYSTINPVDDLIEMAKPQAVLYAMALGLQEAEIFAGNPIEDKIKRYRIKGDEFLKWQNYILKVINGYNKPRKSAYCKICSLRNTCPAWKKDDSNIEERIPEKS